MTFAPAALSSLWMGAGFNYYTKHCAEDIAAPPARCEACQASCSTMEPAATLWLLLSGHVTGSSCCSLLMTCMHHCHHARYSPLSPEQATAPKQFAVAMHHHPYWLCLHFSSLSDGVLCVYAAPPTQL
jgi:hypothetical protein